MARLKFGIPDLFNVTPKDYQRDGRSMWRVGVVVTTANHDTSIDVTGLGRIPAEYHQRRSKKGGTIYDGTNFGSDWTPTTIVLRSTVAGDTFTLKIC